VIGTAEKGGDPEYFEIIFPYVEWKNKETL
jgi:hypothetical protein